MAERLEVPTAEVAVGGELFVHPVGSLHGDGRLRRLEEVGSIVACDTIIVTTQEDLLPAMVMAIRSR